MYGIVGWLADTDKKEQFDEKHHFLPGNTLGHGNRGPRRYKEATIHAIEERFGPKRLADELEKMLGSGSWRERAFAMSMILSYTLGKPKVSIDVNRTGTPEFMAFLMSSQAEQGNIGYAIAQKRNLAEQAGAIAGLLQPVDGEEIDGDWRASYREEEEKEKEREGAGEEHEEQ